jgi:hypothetical protein
MDIPQNKLYVVAHKQLYGQQIHVFASRQDAENFVHQHQVYDITPVDHYLGNDMVYVLLTRVDDFDILLNAYVFETRHELREYRKQLMSQRQPWNTEEFFDVKIQ